MSKISIKKDYTDGQVLYGSELNANNQVIESGVNDNFTRIQGLDSSKASATDVNNVLATKVSNTTYNADKISMQNKIDAKASITYVNTQLAGKANTSALDSKLDKTSAGSLSALNTTDKSSLVAAINEVNRETLPIATTSSLGGIKPDGTTITVDVDGTAHSVGGGAGGTSDYTSLSNRPSINDVVLVAGLDAADLNLAKASDVELDLLAKANTADVYTKNETNSEITEALTDLTTKTYVDTGLSTKADADAVYTKAETDSAITTATSGKADANDVETSLATKQDKLTAGENIAITNNVISSTGGATIDQSNVAPLDPATGDLWIDTGDTNYLAQVDDEVSTTSTNAVQNKVITEYINDLNTYSTDEQIIGIWIDGKTHYRKYVPISSFSIAGIDVNTGLINVDNITNFCGSFKRDNVGEIVFYSITNSFMAECRFYKNTGIYHLATNNAEVAFSGYVILYYTKTTD